MDFTKFDAAVSTADWVHLEIDKQKLYWDGQSLTLEKTEMPCRVRLKGVGANEVFEAFERYQRAEMTHANHLKKANAAQVDAITVEHAEKSENLMDDLIIAACEDWENIYFDGKAEKMTPARIRHLIDRKSGHSKRSIRAFLFKAIAERRANLTDAA